MSILITGISGNLGNHVLKLVREKYPKRKIRCLLLPSERDLVNKFKEYNIDVFFGDLGSKESLKGCFEEIDSIIHIAAVVDDLTPLPAFYRINHLGTKHLLDEFVKSEAKTFIYMSTLGVYGYDLPDFPIDENYITNLMPGYRESKYLGEQEVFKYAEEYGFKASSLRSPIFFGPGDMKWTPNIYNLVKSAKKIPLINKGEITLSYSYVEDVAEALIKMEESDKAKGEIFNHASFHIRKKEMFEIAAKICNVPFNSFNLNYQLALFIGLIGEWKWKLFKKKALLNRYRVYQMGRNRIIDTTKIEKLLGLTNKYSFEEALKITFEWYENQL